MTMPSRWRVGGPVDDALRAIEAAKKQIPVAQQSNPSAVQVFVPPAIAAGASNEAILRNGLTSSLRARGVPQAKIDRVQAMPITGLAGVAKAYSSVVVDYSKSKAQQNVKGALGAIDAAIAASKAPRIGFDLGGLMPELPANIPAQVPAPKDLGDKALAAVRSVPVVGEIAAAITDLGVDVVGGMGDFAMRIVGQSPEQRNVRNAIAAINAQAAVLEAQKAFAKAGDPVAQKALAERGIAVPAVDPAAAKALEKTGNPIPEPGFVDALVDDARDVVHPGVPLLERATSAASIVVPVAVGVAGAMVPAARVVRGALAAAGFVGTRLASTFVRKKK